MKKKGQVSLEFMFIFAFALIIFVLLLALLMQFLESGRNNRILQEYEYVADSISKNLLIAAKGPGIVELSFVLPDKIANQDYKIYKDGNVLVIEDNDKFFSVRFPIPDIDDSSIFNPGNEHIIYRDISGDILISLV